MDNPSLSQNQEVRVVFDYFSGKSQKEICKENKLSEKKFKNILCKWGNIAQKDVIFKKREIQMARENDRIVNIKDRIYDAIINGIEKASDRNDLVEQFTRIKDILGKVDEIFRLNNDMSTSNVKNENINKNVEVHKVLEQLKTDEDKKRFLQKRAINF